LWRLFSAPNLSEEFRAENVRNARGAGLPDHDGAGAASLAIRDWRARTKKTDDLNPFIGYGVLFGVSTRLRGVDARPRQRGPLRF
jgi:hypothetical protein